MYHLKRKRMFALVSYLFYITARNTWLSQKAISLGQIRWSLKKENKLLGSVLVN